MNCICGKTLYEDVGLYTVVIDEQWPITFDSVTGSRCLCNENLQVAEDLEQELNDAAKEVTKVYQLQEFRGKSSVPYRRELVKGLDVVVIQKKNYESGHLTVGRISKVLTKSSFHHRGIKVRLENGIVGRVLAVYGSHK